MLDGRGPDRASCIQFKWALLLPFASVKDWWRLQELTQGSKVTVQPAIGEALRSLVFDTLHPHGGPVGMEFAAVVQAMICKSAMQPFLQVCAELRRRSGASLPWLVRSRALVMHAAGHANTQAPLEALFALAPHAAEVVCKHRGFTPLHEAVFCRKTHNVKFLLSAKCDVRFKSFIGETALHVACHGRCAQSMEIAEHLLARDPGLLNIMDEVGMLPLDRARDARRRRMIAKRNPTEEEEIIAVRFFELLTPNFSRSPTESPAEGIQDDPAVASVVGEPAIVRQKCKRCGFETASRRTRNSTSFCGVCGFLR